MKTSEFKAWFEGFVENLDGAPTAAQFDKIRAKVAEIDETAVTERVYLDRYVYPHRKWWGDYWSTTSLRDDDGEWVARAARDGTPMLPGETRERLSPVDRSGVAHIWDPDRNPIRFGSGSLSEERDDSVLPMNAGVDNIVAKSRGRHLRDHGIFDSLAAMRELGRMEATSMAA